MERVNKKSSDVVDLVLNLDASDFNENLLSISILLYDSYIQTKNPKQFNLQHNSYRNKTSK